MGFVKPQLEQGSEEQLRYWLESCGFSDNEIEDYVIAMVDADEWLSAPVGVLQEEYDRIMGIVECADKGILSFIGYSEEQRLRVMSPSFCADWDFTTGFNIIMDSIGNTHLYTTDYYGHIFYFIFDEEMGSDDANHIQDIGDYIIFNNEFRETLERVKLGEEETTEQDDPDDPDTGNDEKTPVGAYNAGVRWLKQHNTNDEYYCQINMLVNQYYYGLAPQKELADLLDYMGVEYVK